MTKFQIITLGLFVVFLIVGVVSFALYKGNTSDSSTALPSITLWGTFPASVFSEYLAHINNDSAVSLNITYKQINASSFSQEFIAALARGSGPDAILVPADMLLPHVDKLALIPYTALPARTFVDTYIQEAQIYTTQAGILALPFTVDPLLMYWNRDMFNSNAIPSYPRYWDEFTTLNAKLTQKDTNGNIRTSAVAFGDFTNVVNAREIVASLLMQISNPITAYNAQGSLVSTLRSTSASSQPKLAFDYFAQSVDPTNTNYSWNRGMPDSRTAFLFGRLATYFGFASEISDIRSKNPNLNFDIAPLPQARTGGIKASYARMYGLSIVRSSSNINGTYQVLAALTSPTNLAYLSQQMYLPPVLISLISAGSSDPYMTIFNAAALIGKTWLDVDPGTSMVLFGDAVEAITSGQSSSFQAVENAGLRYDVLLRQATGQ